MNVQCAAERRLTGHCQHVVAGSRGEFNLQLAGARPHKIAVRAVFENEQIRATISGFLLHKNLAWTWIDIHGRALVPGPKLAAITRLFSSSKTNRNGWSPAPAI